MLRLLLFISVVLFSFYSFSEPKKVALIVAIGDYPERGGWKKLNSLNDIPLIESALNQHGFLKENIVVVKDHQATKVGIIKALEELYKVAESGDIVFFHFSGHGQQIIDLVGDEIDGLDEALVPIDAGLNVDLCQAKGNNHIRDDYLNEIFSKIRKKIGAEGDLLVVLDACHSGTATRGLGVSRGTSVIFGSPDQLNAISANFNLNQSFIDIASDQQLAPMVVISGSSATEQNYEYVVDGISYGSLSFAFSQVLHQVTTESTYRSIFEKVRTRMSSMVPRQNPQVEGYVDRTLFAGKAVEQKNYVNVKLWRNPESILIDAGQLNGIHQNTRVEIHPMGTTNPSESTPLATGTIVNAQLAESLVILDKAANKDVLEKSWVFISEMSYGSNRVPIQLSDQFPAPFVSLLKTKLTNSKRIKIVDTNAELFIDLVNHPDAKLMLITRDEQIIYSYPMNEQVNFEELSVSVFEQINRYIQAKILRSLNATNPRIRLSFELIPLELDNSFRELSRSTIASKTNEVGQIVFNHGDYFKIRITNHGNRQAFYTLMDIQPDNTVNILVPEKDAHGNPFRAPSDCRIGPGQTEELRAVFYIQKPYGQEVFKLISSNRPLNLDQVLTTRGEVSNQGSLHPFEALFSETFNELTRGDVNHRLPPEIINIHTIVFQIEPKDD